jgi:hypothetical protein
MVKESLQTPYNSCIFRETFNSESSVLRNGGQITDVSFENGVGSFNGTNSKINYNLGLNGTYSVRIIANITNLVAGNPCILDCRSSSNTGTGLIFVNSGVITPTNGTVYVNGVASTTAIAKSEITITGISLIQGTGANLSLIGLTRGNSNALEGSIDLIEIYKGTLTASEVKNLYSG